MPSWLQAVRTNTAATLFWFVFVGSAHATPITVVNHSFENITGESPYNEFTFGPFPGWGLYDPGAITDGGDGPTFFIGTLTPTVVTSPPNYEFFPSGASDGNRVGMAFSFFGSGGSGAWGLEQTLADTLQANTTYTLQVDIGNIGSGTAVDTTPYNLNGFPGYRVDLLAGGVVVASDNSTLTGTIAEGTFATSTVQLTTGISHLQFGQSLGIRLVNLNEVDPLAPTADLEVDFDNVRLAAVPVPEPATIALVIAGLILMSEYVISRRLLTPPCATKKGGSRLDGSWPKRSQVPRHSVEPTRSVDQGCFFA